MSGVDILEEEFCVSQSSIVRPQLFCATVSAPRLLVTAARRSPTTRLYWSLAGISAGLTPLKPGGPPTLGDQTASLFTSFFYSTASKQEGAKKVKYCCCRYTNVFVLLMCMKKNKNGFILSMYVLYATVTNN